MSSHTNFSHYFIQIATFLLALYAYITPATAQNSTQTSIEQSRKLIHQEKIEIESSYKEKELLCLKKFVATPCINDAKQQKTKALANIKQQELVLNEQERALKKAKIESKQTQFPIENSQLQSQTPDQIKSNDAQRNSEEQANNVQLQKQQQKQSQAQTQAKLRVNQADKKNIESTKKANRRADKSKQESATSAKYQSKVAAAQARKNAIDERNANRSKPKAAPLPIPSPLPTTNSK